ncbi:hypothetical protein L6452_43571 [Arctium lappa]|uniref:Uncharacterized protein n=1 Tax=Arctium lappa TaxID=4217 RepID=A0ACB8XDJ2_ARCLA|nr:hypothetical protein L6452_43571 [Arctium lappa]
MNIFIYAFSSASKFIFQFLLYLRNLYLFPGFSSNPHLAVTAPFLKTVTHVKPWKSQNRKPKEKKNMRDESSRVNQTHLKTVTHLSSNHGNLR